MTEIVPAVSEPTAENVRTWLITRIAHYLHESVESIDPGTPFAEFGLDSVCAFTLCGEIEETLAVNVEPAVIWNVENLSDLTDHIVGLAIG
ncbi:MAG: acyl carrier protein [Trebonia sp.]